MAEEKELTPDERMQWLRDRGILIETPEERKASSSSTLENSTDNDDSSKEKVSYVLVPADTSSPLQELVFLSSKNTPGDALQEHLKPAFAQKSEKVDLSLLQQPAQFQSGETTSGQVSQDTLNEVAKQGHVEIFNLVHPTPSNHFSGINIYLDEIGMLKRLPLNKRASDYAKEAGYNPPPQFYGDVFFGRVQKRGAAVVKNMTLTLSDTNPAADWLQQASTQNLEYQMEMNQITGRNETQPDVAGTDGVASEEIGYEWTQTEEELEVIAALPSADIKSKDLQVKFKPNHIEIKCGKESLVSFELFEKVDTDGCTWTIDRNKDKAKIVVTFEKVEQALWPRIQNYIDL